MRASLRVVLRRGWAICLAALVMPIMGAGFPLIPPFALALTMWLHSTGLVRAAGMDSSPEIFLMIVMVALAVVYLSLAVLVTRIVFLRVADYVKSGRGPD